ncbi:hypothetical protein NDU88_004782 [Pleurodeles waltl]|uniref:Uncharacterized protein n=1 Tax=Pleurodeles waltl TaxID=8319 RepID=A0AAV7LJD7_PLEWA|nr:hypothetical protein NDU88_004782 [Pleurodeles waltl]
MLNRVKSLPVEPCWRAEVQKLPETGEQEADLVGNSFLRLTPKRASGPGQIRRAPVLPASSLFRGERLPVTFDDQGPQAALMLDNRSRMDASKMQKGAPPALGARLMSGGAAGVRSGIQRAPRPAGNEKETIGGPVQARDYLDRDPACSHEPREAAAAAGPGALRPGDL